MTHEMLKIINTRQFRELLTRDNFRKAMELSLEQTNKKVFLKRMELHYSK